MNLCSTCRAILPLVLCASGLFAGTASAGATWDTVHVETFTPLSDTNYILIVATTPSEYSVFGRCRHYQVRGSLSRLDGIPWIFSWFYNGGPTKESHIAALKYLQKSERLGNAVRFGAMGYAFNPINPKHRCIVESRGLRLLEGAVVSYCHEI